MDFDFKRKEGNGLSTKELTTIQGNFLKQIN